jgi:hypothetical protein
MARPRQQPPPEPSKPPAAPSRSSAKARTDDGGLTWPPSITGWRDRDGRWHEGDPRRVLAAAEEFTVEPVTSIDAADTEDQAAREARLRKWAETQAKATEEALARRRARPAPDPQQIRTIRVNRR